MKKTLLIFPLLLLSVFLNAQNITKTVDTRYLRPSLTTLFIQPKTSQENVIITKFKSLPVLNKYDDNHIDFPNLTISPNESDRTARVLNYVQQASNPIVAKWWNRDTNGDFNTDFVAKRGGNSAIDADIIQAKASATNRIEMIGAELIDKSYVYVYELNEVLTMEQVYDRTDANNRKYSNNYKSVQRDDEGFEAKYTVYIYKLNFNDSVSTVFYSNYWSDAKNHNSQKVDAWKNAVFPMEFKAKHSATIRSAQPKDPKSIVYYASKKKSMNELLEDCASLIQTGSESELGMKLEDLKAKVAVYKTKPLSAKVGTKESLYLDQRFFIYELEMDKNGNQSKVQKGVVRVKEIADNNTVASGATKPSVFQQQGGHKLYEGMLMESNEDKGLAVGGGYAISSDNQSLGGLNLNVDYRISRIVKVPGVSFGLDGYVNFFDKISVGKVSANSQNLTNTSDLMGGISYGLVAYIAKEMYFTRRGIVYLRPSVGAGISAYSMNIRNGNLIPDVTDSKGNTVHDPDYIWSTVYIPLTLGIGFNITPQICLEIKPSAGARFGSVTGNGEGLTRTGGYDQKWGIENLDKLSFNTSTICNLRFRF